MRRKIPVFLTALAALSFSALIGMHARAQTVSMGAASQVSTAPRMVVPRAGDIVAPAKNGAYLDIKGFDPSHKLVWERKVHNLLTTAGANVYVNTAIMGGIPVSAESDGNSGGSATAVTGTLLQTNTTTTGQISTIAPGTVSFSIASYSGTFGDTVAIAGSAANAGKGLLYCSGTCTGFTQGATSNINYNTGAIALAFGSGGPYNSQAITGAYSYVPVKWYVGLIYNTSGSNALCPTYCAITDTLASNGWSGGNLAEVGASQVSNTTRPAFTASAVSGGSTTNSGNVATYTGAGTATLEGAFLTNSNLLDGTSYGQLLGEASFTAAPISSGYTIQVTVTNSISAG
jgi:hypothetical protein